MIEADFSLGSTKSTLKINQSEHSIKGCEGDYVSSQHNSNPSNLLKEAKSDIYEVQEEEKQDNQNLIIIQALEDSSNQQLSTHDRLIQILVAHNRFDEFSNPLQRIVERNMLEELSCVIEICIELKVPFKELDKETVEMYFDNLNDTARKELLCILKHIEFEKFYNTSRMVDLKEGNYPKMIRHFAEKDVSLETVLGWEKKNFGELVKLRILNHPEMKALVAAKGINTKINQNDINLEAIGVKKFEEGEDKKIDSKAEESLDLILNKIWGKTKAGLIARKVLSEEELDKLNESLGCAKVLVLKDLQKRVGDNKEDIEGLIGNANYMIENTIDIFKSMFK